MSKRDDLMSAAITRRSLLLSGLVFLGSGLAAGAKANALYGGEDQEYFNPDLLPPAESEIDYPIEPVNPRRIRKKFRRTVVEFNGNAQPGTIFVDPDNRYLYHVIAPGQATRYGVGVGRQGFEWSGDAIVGIKRRWPRWVPPRTMVDRDANALRWVNGQPGGPDNPLGARALYLYANGVDTLYRIHGTNDPSSIGKAMSSGCIRMLNEDVAHLFDLVEIGTPVIVLPSRGV
jgi:lipoprotein-anchoring transpeptidase ErfK/SrfK